MFSLYSLKARGGNGEGRGGLRPPQTRNPVLKGCPKPDPRPTTQSGQKLLPQTRPDWSKVPSMLQCFRQCYSASATVFPLQSATVFYRRYSVSVAATVFHHCYNVSATVLFTATVRYSDSLQSLQ
ncbi:hypothetical protein Q3G72_021630 [Acer saccharum]|nr:hypothetical protein Q3G72_021630 [Acer saccharum]